MPVDSLTAVNSSGEVVMMNLRNVTFATFNASGAVDIRFVDGSTVTLAGDDAKAFRLPGALSGPAAKKLGMKSVPPAE
jgi:hypothetical protein